MKQQEIVVIRVITLADEELLQRHGRLIEQYYPVLRTSSFCIPRQPRGICSPETKTMAVPKIVELAKAHQDARAIVISCCDDPAVEELRRDLSVPVIGAGSSVCAAVQSLGRRPGIIGIMKDIPETYKRILGQDLIYLGRPENVTCTLDLMTNEGREGVLKKARELKAHGADCIALACTGMSTVGLTHAIEEACGLPVVDPVMAEGLFACYACLRNEK